MRDNKDFSESLTSELGSARLIVIAKSTIVDVQSVQILTSFCVIFLNKLTEKASLMFGKTSISNRESRVSLSLYTIQHSRPLTFLFQHTTKFVHNICEDTSRNLTVHVSVLDALTVQLRLLFSRTA